MITVYCDIMQGKLKTDDKTLKDLIAMQKNGRYMMTIDAVKERRTIKQLRFWWGVVLVAFMEHCGYDRHEIPQYRKVCHDSLKALYESPATLKNLITGKDEPKLWSMSDCSREKLTNFIEWFTRYSAMNHDFVFDNN
jgi:hypothetical protein